jgi:hypothetical protein
VRGFDEDHILRAAAVKQAELIALQERYPYLIYPKEVIERISQNVDREAILFKSQVTEKFENVTTREIFDIVIFVLAVLAIKKVGVNREGIAAVLSAAGVSADFISKNLDQINELYRPLGQATNLLNQMKVGNQLASIKRCEVEQYRPHLLMVFDDAANVPNYTNFIDLNNPHKKLIRVIGD